MADFNVQNMLESVSVNPDSDSGMSDINMTFPSNGLSSGRIKAAVIKMLTGNGIKHQDALVKEESGKIMVTFKVSQADANDAVNLFSPFPKEHPSASATEKSHVEMSRAATRNGGSIGGLGSL